LKLTLAEKVAMLYTRVGTQSAVARELGISHQRVGRLLRTALGTKEPGAFEDDSPALKNKKLIESVEKAYTNHVEATRKLAKQQRLPFNKAAPPIFMARMPHADGKPGNRVEAAHLHWVSDRLRESWLRSTRNSGKFYAVSVGSIVDLPRYNRMANAIRSGQKLSGRRTKKQAYAKQQILNAINGGVARGIMQAPLLRWEKNNKTNDEMMSALNDQLRQRHASAVGTEGTHLASRVLFQVKLGANDTSKAKSKPAKAAGNKRGRK
jgi:hypothetical protein